MRTGKWMILVLIVLIVMICGGNSALAAQVWNMEIVVNGEVVPLSTPLVIENSRTLVPFRPILEALGADVEWAAETRSIIATNEDAEVLLQIDDPTAHVKGSAVKLDVAAKIIDDQTFVPLRFVSEALGANVFFEEKTTTIYISKGFYGNTPSNLVNGGNVLAVDDGYYIGLRKGLTKYDNDSNEEETLTDTYVTGLNKVGDYLYFLYEGDIGRYNIKTMQLEILPDDQDTAYGTECLTVYDNWIYYVGKNDAIYRMRLDGSGVAVLNTSGANDFFICDAAIYFGNGADDCRVYRMDLNGKNVKKVCDVKGSYSLTGVPYDGWIYFTAEPQYVTNLYRMRPDGSELEMVREDMLYFGLYGEKIVFTVTDYDFFKIGEEYCFETYYQFFAIGLTGGKTEKLYDGDGFPSRINFTDANGFYYSILQNNEKTIETAEGYYYYSFDKDDIELIDPR